MIVNNGMYGTIRMHQEKHYPGRVHGTDLVNPHFAAYARSFGAAGEIVEETAAVRAGVRALRRLREAGGDRGAHRSAGDHAQHDAGRDPGGGFREEVTALPRSGHCSGCNCCRRVGTSSDTVGWMCIVREIAV